MLLAFPFSEFRCLSLSPDRRGGRLSIRKGPWNLGTTASTPDACASPAAAALGNLGRCYGGRHTSPAAPAGRSAAPTAAHRGRRLHPPPAPPPARRRTSNGRRRTAGAAGVASALRLRLEGADCVQRRAAVRHGRLHRYRRSNSHDKLSGQRPAPMRRNHPPHRRRYAQGPGRPARPRLGLARPAWGGGG